MTAITFLILILNLLIAILTNVFNIYQDLSTGLFLLKILSTREQLESDEYYGAFISATVPFNIFLIPFIPFGVFMKKSEKLIKLNKFLNLLQYMCLMAFMFIGFIAVSLMLIPIAFTKSIAFKIRAIYSIKETSKKILIKEILSFTMFLFFGIFMLMITFIADCYYFWVNNFRTNLKKIVVDNEKSNLSLESFKKLVSFF